MIKNKEIDYKFIFFILFSLFIFSSNIAWLNPFPEWSVYKSFNTIPFLWQYDIDNPIELATAAYFPDFYYENPTRLERPGYPIIVNILTRASYLFGNQFLEYDIIYYAAASYQLTKLLITFLAIFCAYKLLNEYLNKDYAKIGIILYFFQWSAILYLCDIHTTDTHINNPIFLIFFLNSLFRNYSLFKNFIFGLCIGYLMLIKSNYAIYLAIIIFCIYKKEYFKIIINFLCHLIPFLLWYLFLEYKNIIFYLHNEGNEGGDMIVFLIDHINKGEYLIIFDKILHSIKLFLILILKYYHFFLIPSVLGFYFFLSHFNKTKELFFIIILILFCCWLQFFLALKFDQDVYMAGDLSFLIYFLIAYLFQKKAVLNFKCINILSITCTVIIINLISLINLPYINPYNQKSIDWKSEFSKKKLEYKSISE